MSLQSMKLCRTCLVSDSNSSFLSLFEKESEQNSSITEMLQAITELKVFYLDGFPDKVCSFCIKEINRSYLFKNKCLASHQTLIKLLKDEEKNEKLHLKPLETRYDRKHKPVASQNFNNTNTISPLEKYLAQDENKDNLDAQQQITFKDNSSIVFKCEVELETITEIHVDSKEQQSKFLTENYDYDVCKNKDITFEKSTCNSIITDNVTLIKCKPKKPLKCPHCPQEFIHSKNLEKHCKRHLQASDKVKQNKIISKVQSQDRIENLDIIKENNLIYNSIINDGDNTIYKCESCGANFKHHKSLSFHAKLNRCTQKAFECLVCNKVFVSKNKLVFHMDSHTYPFECTKCLTKFQLEEDLKYHINNKHVNDIDSKNECNICKKRFTMVSGLKDHLRIHSGEKPYLCSICGKGFTQNTNLKQHLMRHSKIKPFKCSQCSFVFVSKGELNSHIRKHTGEHPFVCDICGSGFTTSSSMQKHKRTHTGERPYACDYCPMRFAALGTMKNHRRTHTGEKPFICKFCKKGFSQQSDCIVHIRSHTGERPYVCSICGLAFKQSYRMKTHFKKFHSEQKG